MIFVDGFAVDCAVSIEIVRNAEVTRQPVESGSDRTDHVRNDPVVVNVDCRISDTPLGNVAALRTGIPSEEGRAKLVAVFAAREPVTLETSVETFDRMALSTLTEPRDAKTGGMLSFRATFTEIVIVTNERSFVPVEARTKKRRDVGNKAAVEKTDEKAKRRASALANVADGEGFHSNIVDEILGGL